MAPSTLYRWAGYAGIAGAVLLVAGVWLHPASLTVADRGAWEVAHELVFCAVVLLIPALVALYTRQWREIGVPGLLGAVLIFAGLMGVSGLVWFEAFVSPALIGDPGAAAALARLEAGSLPSLALPVVVIGSVAFALGWLLFGWTTARAGILPRTGAFVALVGALLFGLGPILLRGVPMVDKVAATLFGIGFAWLAWAVTVQRRMLIAGAAS